MTMPILSGNVRAFVERPADRTLIRAANALFEGSDPTEIMNIMGFYRDYPTDEIEIDPSFGAIPIGSGADAPLDDPRAFVIPESSKKFLVSVSVKLPKGGVVPSHLKDKSPIHSNPVIGGLLNPCRPTCGSSQAVGDAETVRQRLGYQTLQDNGLTGAGVGIAIVDSGIFKPRLEQLLGEVMKPKRAIKLDPGNSWRPPGLGTQPGYHRVGHGTMCAYDALIAAPEATLLDFPMLLARQTGDHRSTGTVAAALQAYSRLLWVQLLGTNKDFDRMVVSNSWGLFHPALEDFPPNHPYRFIDNPKHIFNAFIKVLTFLKVDIVFCGNNCGDDSNCAGACASGTCLSETDRMIMGANAYKEVLTVGGCDTNDEIVGYSSRGPSILNQNKPDLVAYTHFLGSKSQWFHVPDTGVSAACPVAAGCVAALRTPSRGTRVDPADLFEALRVTAHKPVAKPGWDPAFGHGIIRPVAAGRKLLVIP